MATSKLHHATCTNTSPLNPQGLKQQALDLTKSQALPTSLMLVHTDLGKLK